MNQLAKLSGREVVSRDPKPKVRRGMKSSKPGATADEKRHMGRVAALGCILCLHLGQGATPAIVHHLRTGQGKMRASHYDTMPLCPTHHMDSGIGLHDMGRDEFARLYRVSEVELLARTKLLLGIA